MNRWFFSEIELLTIGGPGDNPPDPLFVPVPVAAPGAGAGPDPGVFVGRCTVPVPGPTLAPGVIAGTGTLPAPCPVSTLVPPGPVDLGVTGPDPPPTAAGGADPAEFTPAIPCPPGKVGAAGRWTGGRVAAGPALILGDVPTAEPGSTVTGSKVDPGVIVDVGLGTTGTASVDGPEFDPLFMGGCLA